MSAKGSKYPRYGPQRGGWLIIADRYKVSSDGCWLWQRYCDHHGYGIVRLPSLGTSDNGPLARAHRYTYELVHGPVPMGLKVLHHCDVRNCINPAHLFVGTDADNNLDMRQKGRARYFRGEQISNAKLTEDKVRAIRKLLALYDNRKLGRLFNISRLTIRDIRRGRTWSHVDAA